MTWWLGIDLGTQGARAELVDREGAVRGSGSAGLPPGSRSGNRHEQDPDDWWSALCAATRAATAELGGRPLGGLAIDSTSGTILVQGPDGRPRTPGLMYDDGRAVEDTEVVREAGAALWAELGYRVQRSWALPKARWLVRHGALGAGDRIVHQADHLVTRLTGHAVPTDASHALKTGFDLLRLRWPADVLDAVGVPVPALPEVVLPGATLGTVCAAAAARTGIPAGTPVRAGMTDGCAAQIAAGALAPGAWTSALGTTLVVKGSTEALLRDPAGAVYSHRHPDGGWLPGGASSTGAGVIATEFAGADLDALTAAAARLGPLAGTRYPLAGRGERFPFAAPTATGFAQGVGADPAERFAAVLEGVAFTERLAYEVLHGLGADTAGPVAFSGGATRNAYWNQLRADVLGRVVRLPASVQAAYGMAVLAAAPPGELTATAGRMVRIAAELEPDARRGERYAEGYRRFVAALTDRGWLPVGAAR